ncbi:MAG: ribosome silencing factor [Bryobacteraceae bacterium]|nr:ribosome silencing factor [Bryobacteraceae bacterium]
MTAVHAAESKKAINVRVLDLREVTSFTDYFVICSGSNPRQIQAICDEIQAKLAEEGEFPTSVEGYQTSEWVLADYGDMVVHVFSEKARDYYELERLWRGAREVEIPQAVA